MRRDRLGGDHGSPRCEDQPLSVHVATGIARDIARQLDGMQLLRPTRDFPRPRGCAAERMQSKKISFWY